MSRLMHLLANQRLRQLYERTGDMRAVHEHGEPLAKHIRHDLLIKHDAQVHLCMMSDLTGLASISSKIMECANSPARGLEVVALIRRLSARACATWPLPWACRLRAGQRSAAG